MMMDMSSPVNRLLPVPARSCRDVARPSPLLRTVIAAAAMMALALPAAAYLAPTAPQTALTSLSTNAADM